MLAGRGSPDGQDGEKRVGRNRRARTDRPRRVSIPNSTSPTQGCHASREAGWTAALLSRRTRARERELRFRRCPCCPARSAASKCGERNLGNCRDGDRVCRVCPGGGTGCAPRYSVLTGWPRTKPRRDGWGWTSPRGLRPAQRRAARTAVRLREPDRATAPPSAFRPPQRWFPPATCSRNRKQQHRPSRPRPVVASSHRPAGRGQTAIRPDHRLSPCGSSARGGRRRREQR
jgi:hypothetical protein